MYERYTERARQVVVLARTEAQGNGNNTLTAQHILGGLLAEGEGLAASVLQEFGVTLEQARKHYPPKADQGFGNDILNSNSARSVFDDTLREALALGQNYVGTEHILLAFLRSNDIPSVNAAEIREAVMVKLRGVSTARTSGSKEFFTAVTEGPTRLFIALIEAGFVASLSAYPAPTARSSGWKVKRHEYRINIDGDGVLPHEAIEQLAGIAKNAGYSVEFSTKHGITLRPTKP